MKSINRLLTLLVLLFTSFNFYTCKSNETIEPKQTYFNNYKEPVVTFSASVSGFVEDESHQPVSGAVVSAGRATATTNNQGYFAISKADFTGDFCYIKATNKGFFTGSTTIHGNANNTFATTIVMVRKTNVQTFAASQGGTISVVGGAQANFPANAIQTVDGLAYNGKVNISIAHLNPTSDNFSNLIPGGDLRAYSKDGKDVQLYSLGMLNIELEDEAGKPLQLAKGKQAQLTIPVPTSMQADATATIPLWYFDEIKGVWIEEGEAILQNGSYVGNVSHFTPWNCDKPFPPSVLNFTIVDVKGDPVSYAKVRIGQFTASANGSGKVVSKVVSRASLNIDVVDEYGIPTGATIKTPFLEDNKEYDLGKIVFNPKNRSSLVGIIKNCDGSPLNGYGYMKYNNSYARFIITNSKLDVLVPNNGQEAEIFVYDGTQGTFSIFPITLPTDGTDIDLGEKKICNTINGEVSISFEYERNDGKGKQTVSYKYAAPYTGVCRLETINNAPIRTKIYFSDVYPENAIPKQSLYHFFFFINGGGEGIYPLIGGSVYPIGKGFAQLYFNDKNMVLRSSNMVMTITHLGKETEFVKGTFSGTATVEGTNEVVTITNGQFVAERLINIR